MVAQQENPEETQNDPFSLQTMAVILKGIRTPASRNHNPSENPSFFQYNPKCRKSLQILDLRLFLCHFEGQSGTRSA